MVSKGQSLLPNACSLIVRVIRVQCGWTSQFSKDGAAAIPFLSKKSRRSKKDLFCPYSITIDHFQKKSKGAGGSQCCTFDNMSIRKG